MGGDAAIICRTPCFVRKNHEIQHRVRWGLAPLARSRIIRYALFDNAFCLKGSARQLLA